MAGALWTNLCAASWMSCLNTRVMWTRRRQDRPIWQNLHISRQSRASEKLDKGEAPNQAHKVLLWRSQISDIKQLTISGKVWNQALSKVEAAWYLQSTRIHIHQNSPHPVRILARKGSSTRVLTLSKAISLITTWNPVIHQVIAVSKVHRSRLTHKSLKQSKNIRLALKLLQERLQ